MVNSLFKSFFTLILFCFFQVGSAQTWQKVGNSGGSNLTDVVFVSKSRGFLLGYQKVFMTTDTGKTWNRILSGYGNFSRIMFADANNGFIIGYNDLVLKTTDGGNNWSLIRTGNSDDDLIALYPINKDTLFVLGPDDLDTYKYGNYLEYTYNGGSSWSRRSTGSTQTIRSMYMWNRNKGLMSTLTGGVYQTNDGFVNYSVNWNANNIIDTRVIKDSVVVAVGNSGQIFRSSDYGNNWKKITSGTTEHLRGLHFANDSIGMATGERGTILYTGDGGLSWSKMSINTSLTIWKVFVINKYYAWAVGLSANADTMDIFKYGSEKFVSQKINTVKGQVVADVFKNCKKDSKESGPDQILIKAVPGPYYTYTLTNGTYELVIPDTGKYTVTAILPSRYGGDKNQCDTVRSHTVQFKSYENTALSKNFYFKADSSVKLEINIASSRKRRCAVNNNVITYKNIGTKAVDSTVIQLIYSPLIDIVKADRSYQKSGGVITFKTGKLLPGHEGTIYVLDSVLCNDPEVRGMTACIQVRITPKVLVEKTTWDSSWVKAAIKCVQDSIAIVKLINDGTKPMKDSAVLDLFLDDTKVDSKGYKLAAHDSLKFEMKPEGKLVFIETVLKKQHPYLEHIRLFKERCGDSAGFFSKQKVTTHALQELPSFEDEICLEIRDSYDPNDISVSPEGYTDRHYIKNENKLRYTIRFQNTGTDTAYNITVIDTLPKELNISTLEFLGASHKYTHRFVNGQKQNVLRMDFKNIFLVDSFTHEKLSHGFISFDVRLNDSLKKGTRIENFVDIYFDFNPPVRTNTAFNTLYDTTLTQYDPNAARPCMSHFVKVPRDTVICDKYDFEAPFVAKGAYKPTWEVNDFLTNLYRLNDTVAQVKTVHEGKFIISFELKSCENTWYDTATTFFWKNPTIKVKDSLYCGAVDDNLFFNCFACAYLWNDTLESYNFQANKPGTYWVKVTNLCKSISDTFTLSALPYLKLDLGKDTLLCDNAKMPVKVQTKPGTLLWGDSDTASVKWISKPGRYTLEFKNACNHLFDTLNVEYRRTPRLNLGPDSMYCLKVSHPVNLDSVKNEFDILWGDGSSASQRQITDTGMYNVTLKGYCGTATDALHLTALQIPSVNLGSDSVYCSGFTRNVLLNPGVPIYHVLWRDGSNALNRDFRDTGIYWVLIENRCGAVRDTLRLSRAYLPDFKLGNDTLYCNPFTRELNASAPGATYLWSTGETTERITVKSKGTYWGKATTYCGSVTRSITLDQNAAPQVRFGKDTTLDLPFQILLNAGNPGNRYRWSTGDTSQQIQVTDHGTYWVNVNNPCGMATDTISFFKPVVIPIKPHVKVYPNPITGSHLTISVYPGSYALELWDAFGRLVRQVEGLNLEYSLDLSGYSQGTYYLRIKRSTGGSEVYRLIRL